MTKFPILLGAKSIEVSTGGHCCTMVVTAGNLEGRVGRGEGEEERGEEERGEEEEGVGGGGGGEGGRS